MQLISHRVNTIKQLRNLNNYYGIEIDIRDNEKDLVVVHNPFEKGVRLDKYLKYYNHKIKMVLSFKSEIKRTKSIWINQIENECVSNGNIINKKYAEAFEVVKISSGFKIL